MVKECTITLVTINKYISIYLCLTPSNWGARCSSVVKYPLVAGWVIVPIPRGGMGYRTHTSWWDGWSYRYLILDPPPPHGLQIQFLISSIFFTLNDFPTFDNNDDDDSGSLTEIDRKTTVYQACGYTTGVWVRLRVQNHLSASETLLSGVAIVQK